MISALKLFTGPDDQQDRRRSTDPNSWTIRQAFEEIKLPELKRQKRSDGSIAKWNKAVWYWEQVSRMNPPLSQIGDDDLNAFPEQLVDPDNRFGIRTNTAANQQLMYINGILNSCRKLIDRVPSGSPLPKQAPTKVRRSLSDDVLNELYFACRSATVSYDSRIPAPLLWRSLLVLYLSIGCRRCEGARMPASALMRTELCPDLPGLDIEAESPFGWLVFHTPKTRSRKGGLPLVLPVSKPLREHLDELDRLSPNRRRLFPIGDHPSTWRKQFNRIQKSAGISPPFTFQELRKTANRRFRRAADRETAAFMLGHSARGVNATFYDDLTDDAIAMINSMPWPNAFDSLAS